VEYWHSASFAVLNQRGDDCCAAVGRGTGRAVATFESFDGYVAAVVLRDVVERHGVSNIEALRALLHYVLRHPTTKLSIHKLYLDFKSRGLRVAKDEVYTFIRHLTDSYLFFQLPIWTRSERKPPKTLSRLKRSLSPSMKNGFPMMDKFRCSRYGNSSLRQVSRSACSRSASDEGCNGALSAWRGRWPWLFVVGWVAECESMKMGRHESAFALWGYGVTGVDAFYHLLRLSGGSA